MKRRRNAINKKAASKPSRPKMTAADRYYKPEEEEDFQQAAKALGITASTRYSVELCDHLINAVGPRAGVAGPGPNGEKKTTSRNRMMSKFYRRKAALLEAQQAAAEVRRQHEVRWRRTYDPMSNEHYYWNVDTEERSWAAPEGVLAAEVRWRRTLDPKSNEHYFWNVDTGEARWEAPEEVPLPGGEQLGGARGGRARGGRARGGEKAILTPHSPGAEAARPSVPPPLPLPWGEAYEPRRDDDPSGPPPATSASLLNPPPPATSAALLNDLLKQGGKPLVLEGVTSYSLRGGSENQLAIVSLAHGLVVVVRLPLPPRHTAARAWISRTECVACVDLARRPVPTELGMQCRRNSSST